MKPILTINELQLELNTPILRVGNRRVRLTRTEFEILTTLAEHREEIVIREHLLGQLSGRLNAIDHSLEVHISHLRTKLRQVAGEEIKIINVYGTGYRLEAA